MEWGKDGKRVAYTGKGERVMQDAYTQEIQMISVKREKKDNTGQQAQKPKKRKIDWIETEAIAAWIGLGYVIGFIVSTIFCIWAMGVF